MDENVFRQSRPTSLPNHMKDKTKFCMLHNDYEHTLSLSRNLYGQLKGMMKKGLLFKYLKKKAPPRLVEKSRELETMVDKVKSKEAKKDP